MPLPLAALHHVALTTRRPAETQAFYCDVLGFAVLPRPPFNFRGAWLYGYGFQIHLIENDAAAPSPGGEISARADHLAFGCRDVAAVKAALGERGIPFREQVNAGGIHQLFFHDPDGHTIEVALHRDPSVGYVAEGG